MDSPGYDPARTRVVLIGSDRENMKKAGALLRNEGFDIALSGSSEEALALCAREAFDLALVEASLSDADAFTLPERLRRGEGREEIRVIFFVDSGDELAVVQAYRAKASDFIRLPYSAEEFLARVRIHAELRFSRQRFLDQYRELEEAYRKLEAYSRIDLLTGLPSPGYFRRRIEQERSRVQRGPDGACFCLLRVRLAGLPGPGKDGDREGIDYALVSLSAAIRSLLREHDLLSRLGDAEFRILLPDCGAEGGRSLSERIQAAAAGLELSAGGRPFRPALEFETAQVTGEDPLPEWIRG